MMDFSIYRHKRTAVLFLGAYDTLPEGLVDWAISDLDAFFENLDMWADRGVPPIQALFSRPIVGLRQHLADRTSVNVGMAGVRLAEDRDLFSQVKQNYLENGYDVIELGPHRVDFTQRKLDNKVRVAFTMIGKEI
jgi:hypothetical protein